MVILKYILIAIDKVLNPKATNYPFLYCQKIPGMKIYGRPGQFEINGVFWVVREFDEGNKHWVWIIRWL